MTFNNDAPLEEALENVELSVGDPTPLQLWEEIKEINGKKKEFTFMMGAIIWSNQTQTSVM